MKNELNIFLFVLSLTCVNQAQLIKSNHPVVDRTKNTLLTKIGIETGKLNFIQDSLNSVKQQWRKEAEETVTGLYNAAIEEMGMFVQKAHNLSNVGTNVNSSLCLHLAHSLQNSTQEALSKAVECYKSKLETENERVQKLLDRVYALFFKYGEIKNEADQCVAKAINHTGKINAYVCIKNIIKNPILDKYSKQTNTLLKEMEKIQDRPFVKPKLFQCGSPQSIIKPIKEQIKVTFDEYVVCIIQVQRDHINSKQHCSE